ncbi:MAG: abortive infection family protein, partial [Acidobacteria bacterium]|nr:abortive infection family protein [Acidobacteriota bacterium]
EIVSEINEMISRIETGTPVSSPTLKTESEAVERAIQDALALLKERGPTSAVDRIHTALHGYLRTACDMGGFTYAKDSTITDLFKTLRRNHPSLQPSGPRAEDITQILKALSTIVGVLNPLRNRASGAHPNPQVLEKDEAMLVINAAISLLHYLDSKLS